MLDGATTNGALPPWEPDEFGLPRAGVVSVVLMALAFGGSYYVATHMPHVPKPVVPTTFVHMVQLPKPKPPPPLPKPPPPVPVPVPKPIPHPIVHHVAPKVTHIPIPVKHVIIHRHKPPPPLKKPPPPPAPPPAPRFNFQSYAAGLRAPIQRLVHVNRAIRMLKLQGTAYIEFTLTPAGQLVSARVYRSSGNPLIDKEALAAVRRMHFPHFPGRADKAFALPIEILPYANNG